jgi:hypothetical protein
MGCLARPRSLEGERAMAFLALGSELARVYVILGMARDAIRAELDLRGWMRVAAPAVQF